MVSHLARQIARENHAIVEKYPRHCPNSSAYTRLTNPPSKGINDGQVIEMICVPIRV